MKKLNKLTQSIALTCAAFALSSTLSTASAEQYVSIGTGGVTGVYYPVGGAICRLVNKDRKQHGIRCTVESTAGSVSNVNAVKSGDLDVGIAQSDIQYNAMHGVNQFAGQEPYSDLRSLFSMWSEAMTLVVRPDSGIHSIEDLKGKRVNLGPIGSGTRAVVGDMLTAAGVKTSDLALATEMKLDENGTALCDNKVDAFFVMIGHPSSNVQDPTTTCGAKLVPLQGKWVADMVAKSSFFSLAVIPGGLYPNNDQDINTLGVKATLVTSASASPDKIYTLVKAVFENLDEFKKLHPVLNGLNPEDMVKQGLSAPIHPGALKYYKEKGML